MRQSTLNLFGFLFMVIFLNSCKEAPLLGLWLVEEVSVNEDTMTPQARWMKFNGDHTQSSGNGWLQHSTGTWSYNTMDSTLTVKNENGYRDPYEPFKVRFENSNMIWSRTEDGNKVTIRLNQINKLPRSAANSLLGVWQLKEITENDRDISARFDTGKENYLFIRWDNVFIEQHTAVDRERGVYRPHGHETQVEFIYNDSLCTREYWNYNIENNNLALSRTYNDTSLVKKYTRIDYFPE